MQKLESRKADSRRDCVCAEFVFVYRMSPLKGTQGSQQFLLPQDVWSLYLTN